MRAGSHASTQSPQPLKIRLPDHQHMQNQRSKIKTRMRLREQGLQDAEVSVGMSPAAMVQRALQLWRPSTNLSIDTVNKRPHKLKGYYQAILGEKRCQGMRAQLCNLMIRRRRWCMVFHAVSGALD
ncbi:hypothetical protein L7F22_022796 [Adiantum nelumboides]|nr:hypothetical protein [Adiantum nelumboides]